jgi:hypothetical protein
MLELFDLITMALAAAAGKMRTDLPGEVFDGLVSAAASLRFFPVRERAWEEVDFLPTTILNVSVEISVRRHLAILVWFVLYGLLYIEVRCRLCILHSTLLQYCSSFLLACASLADTSSRRCHDIDSTHVHCKMVSTFQFLSKRTWRHLRRPRGRRVLVLSVRIFAAGLCH